MYNTIDLITAVNLQCVHVCVCVFICFLLHVRVCVRDCELVVYTISMKVHVTLSNSLINNVHV